MNFKKTKSVITLMSLLVVGTSFAYGMDDKPLYPPRAQQQAAEAPQAGRALRPARFHGFYGLPVEDEGSLSSTEKSDYFLNRSFVGHENHALNRKGIAGVDGTMTTRPLMPPVQFSAEWRGAVSISKELIEDDDSIDVD